ncbi:2-amino-4-hydroxy-6-hydroxymethyldihydropteridine diphosphokinase [Gallaecimonas kandeliae]|uniref:2-amino-4-hydroxy-6- hydroxymethyldihydropteridine diphosphokinase n=1 Tax=Gallaecimonas kandeliae TaxID=3029055 RepID=UPI002649B5AF|nr:2-amino-4-hydroxy-6-hydroxymethyldihydropteridine diphosphokinase [Gallaecimonas kandeliae]WKE66308.1 2-amino-4-hydroxy-6-hydroxymethyldihydropteridine diphosphokinase [Gallaecimonas kandeliae]
MSSLAFIGLGANLDAPARQLWQALHHLAALPQSRLLQCSSFYASKPMGPQDQPDYVNAVAVLETGLEPLALLDALQAIEERQGRVRQRRWGERTLDLDLLLFGDQRLDLPRLQVPHYGLKDRDFVLLPLWELAPELVLPDGQPLAALVPEAEALAKVAEPL